MIKRRTKKILKLIIVLILSLSVIGCGFNKKESGRISAEAFLKNAETMALQEEFEMAASMCERAFELESNYTEAYIKYIEYAGKVKDSKPEIAIQKVLEVIDENNKMKYSAELMNYIATYYFTQKNYSQAYYYYCLVDDQQIKDAQLYQNLSQGLANGQDQSLTEEALNEMLANIDQMKDSEEKVAKYESLAEMMMSLELNDELSLSVL